MKRLDEIEARTRAATEGPWTWATHSTADGDEWAVFSPADWALATNRGGWGHDAEFIAHARTDVPALVAVARFALSLHSQDGDRDECGHCADSYGEDGWPCSTVREIHRLLGEDT